MKYWIICQPQISPEEVDKYARRGHGMKMLQAGVEFMMAGVKVAYCRRWLAIAEFGAVSATTIAE